MKSLTLLLAVGLLGLWTAPAQAQIHWIHNLEKGLTEARDRDAPIVALFWDYN